MSVQLLLDYVDDMERAASQSGLDLSIIDRVGNLDRHTPNKLWHRGLTIQPISTSNLSGGFDGRRDNGTGAVEDTYIVQLAHRILPTKQKSSRADALLMEEQVISLFTRLVLGQSSHLRYTGTTARGLHPTHGEWWIASLSFITHRTAHLGG